MALGSTWFDGSGSPSYTDIRCDFDFSSASSTTHISGSYAQYRISTAGWLIFLPTRLTGDVNRLDPNYGYVELIDDSTGDKRGARHIEHTVLSAPATSSSTGENLKRPFELYTVPSTGRINITHSTSTSYTCSVWVHQPWAWYSLPAQVIAAMLISAGLDESYIDQDAFSEADDSQAALTADSDDAPRAYYRRQVGQSIADAAKNICLQTLDFLTITMSGLVAMIARDTDDYVVESLDLDDGVVTASWRYAEEHLVNSAVASHGTYYDVSTEDLPSSHSAVVAGCTEIAYPSVVTERDGYPFDEYSNTTSITKYGERVVGRVTTVIEDQEQRKINALHFPHMLTLDGDSGEMLDSIMARLDVDCQLRREVRVVQDMRGLDYDCGWTVEDVAVTHDGETIDSTRCIRKIVDFRDFTVTSVLLEEPAPAE